MDNFNETLDGPDYFFCEKTNCRLRIAVCIQRQETNRKSNPFEGYIVHGMRRLSPRDGKQESPSSNWAENTAEQRDLFSRGEEYKSETERRFEID